MINGSIFIENAKIKDKVYIQTLHNDVYINNNQVWVKSSSEFDQIISINSQLNIYNQFIKSNVVLTPLILYNIDKNGNVNSSYSSSLPYYVTQVSDNQKNKNDFELEDLFIEEFDLIPIYGQSKRIKSTDNGFFEIRFNLTQTDAEL